MPRKLRFDELLKAPRELPVICKILGLHQDGQVCKSLVEAIIRATGYHKQHVAFEGTVSPRVKNQDGTLSTSFTPEFEGVILWFLDTLRAGVFFFPLHLPAVQGWRDGSSHENAADRLEWKTNSNQRIIQGGVCLLFEYLKSHPMSANGPIHLRQIWDKPNDGPCTVCGSRKSPDGNDILYCEDCRLGYHQLCENIPEIPKGQWRCVECESLREQKVELTPRKRSRSRHSRVPSPSDDEDRSISHKRTRVSRVSALSASSEGGNADGPGVLLTPEERDGTIFLVSRNISKIHKIVRLGATNDFERLMRCFAEKWEIRSNRIDRLFTRIPAVEGLVELKLSGTGFQELMTIIKRAWNNEVVVYIPIVLLEVGTLLEA